MKGGVSLYPAYFFAHSINATLLHIYAHDCVDLFCVVKNIHISLIYQNRNTMTVPVNIIATVNVFTNNNTVVNIVFMHINDVSPKQFEDTFGNLWFAKELSNFIHF